jgi:hypothetical protein
MAFNPNTAELFPNISVGNTPDTVIIPLADFAQELTLAEVDPNELTSDWRELVFSFLDHLALYYNSLDVTDRPTKLSITKSGRLEQNNEFTYTYNIQITTKSVQVDMAEEPTP